MQRSEKRTHCRALGHLGKGVDVLREALAAIAEFAVWARPVCVRVIDVA